MSGKLSQAFLGVSFVALSPEGLGRNMASSGYLSLNFSLIQGLFLRDFI